MVPLFGRTFSLRSRLTLALLLAFLLMFADLKLSMMAPTRTVLNSLVSPLQYAAVAPIRAYDRLSENIQSRQAMRAEIEQLREQVRYMEFQTQRTQFLQWETDLLRNLLASEAREDNTSMVAEVLAVDSKPFSDQVLINKGKKQGVFLGQAVVDSQGIVGQVVALGYSTAWVLLISDVNHAIPGRTEGEGMRVVIEGTGLSDELDVLFVPHTSALKEGELLFSSGLGGVFPEGYPVARVTTIVRDESQPFAQVTAMPLAELERLRLVLLIWEPEQEQHEIQDEYDEAS